MTGMPRKAVTTDRSADMASASTSAETGRPRDRVAKAPILNICLPRFERCDREIALALVAFGLVEIGLMTTAFRPAISPASASSANLASFARNRACVGLGKSVWLGRMPAAA